MGLHFLEKQLLGEKSKSKFVFYFFIPILSNKYTQFFGNNFTNSIQPYLNESNFLAEKLYNTYLSYYPLPLPKESLKVLHPDIAKQWDIKKNHPLKPEDFTPGSSRKKVWWLCQKGHSYDASISKRTSKKCWIDCCDLR